MRRREFIAGLLFSAVTPHVQARQPLKVYRIAIVHPSIPVERMTEGASGGPSYKALFRDFNSIFQGVQKERKKSNPAYLRA